MELQNLRQQLEQKRAINSTINYDEIALKRETEEREMRLRSKLLSYENSVPKRYKKSSFENFQGFGSLKSLLKSLQGGIIIGGNGCGKTHLGFACCREAVIQGKSQSFITAFDYIQKVKNEFNSGRTGEVFKRYAKIDFLVIDEIDKRYGSSTEFLEINRLINARYSEMLPTLLLSNAKDVQEIQDLLGMAVVDRLTEGGAIIPITAESYRQRSILL